MDPSNISLIKPSTLEANVFRHTVSNQKAIDAETSKKTKGRWHRQNGYGAVYTALEEETAKVEHAKGARKRGLIPAEYGPRDMVAIRVYLYKVLDLTKEDNLRKLNLTKNDLIRDDTGGMELCNQIADYARALGYEAILSFSAANDSGMCLIIYPDKLSSSSVLSEEQRYRFIS